MPVLKLIQGRRLDLKTTIIVLLIAVAIWVVSSWARIKDFIPAEFRAPHDSTAQMR